MFVNEGNANNLYENLLNFTFYVAFPVLMYYD